MVQTFNPENVMLQDSIGKNVANASLTQAFTEELVKTSLVARLGRRVNMTDKTQIISNATTDGLTNAYFVGEGEKIKTAKIEGPGEFYFTAKKIGVILPVTNEFLTYTWSEYFNHIVPFITDEFNRKIDGAAFLGLHNNPFETVGTDGQTVQGNVLGAATESGNVISGDLTTDNIYDLEDLTEKEPNAFVGHRTLNRTLRTLQDGQIEIGNGQFVGGEYIYNRPENGVGRLDDIAYAEIQLGKDESTGERLEYPKGTLLAGNFDNLIYGIPNGTNLKLMISDQATLSTVQNAGPDSGDFHLFEQDSQALRATFEIAVAVPNNKDFAVLQPSETVGV